MGLRDAEEQFLNEPLHDGYRDEEPREPTNDSPRLVSSCCHSPVRLVGSPESTAFHYSCYACHSQCDRILALKTPFTGSKLTPLWWIIAGLVGLVVIGIITNKLYGH